MSEQSVNIGICGLGTVGSGTFNLLESNAAVIAARALAPLRVVHVGARRDIPTATSAAPAAAGTSSRWRETPRSISWWN